MKKILLLLVMLPVLSGCSKNDEYDINMIHGVWKLSSIESSDKSYSNTRSISFIVFKPNGTYYTSGVLGDYSGVYEYENGVITAYSGKDVCLKLEVLSLREMECKFKAYILSNNYIAIIKCYRSLEVIQ